MINLSKISTKSEKELDRKKAEEETSKLRDELFDLQNVLYAEQNHSLLVILQGMDAAGKDGTVRHVFSCMNPMGVDVKAFKAPNEEESKHDFLWRVHQHAPAKGMIQIFNRSHYEDVLVPTVHKDIDKSLIEKRYDVINSFEQNLVDSGTVILKFFLHISKEEQKKRIDERLTKPAKKWKYDPADKAEANNWDAYMEVYEKIFDKCSPAIPWIIVPSDHKWYRSYTIAKEMVKTLKSLKMKYPS
ncbi:MAG TPA: PPK2 family polyphosphate kinase [Bacteroidia bacterium]|jgi:PPK2 family polyphosphate:nucleotide phosphotransferase|nr:PPK2 family polyphosphate kinase [Bacteroidia bacterium]